MTPRELTRRHLGSYIAGGLALAAFQLAMNRIDWLSKAAIDGLFGEDPRAARPAVYGMLGLAAVAFATRIAGRSLILNAGRDAEYELRGHLLRSLHTLGAAFYRTMSAGEIMSRASSDLAQVRLLFGFGALNGINVVLAFASAIQVMLGISWRLTLASFVVFPLLVPISRIMSRRMFLATQADQEAAGRLSETLQSSLSAVRVVRSLGLEERELDRFDRANEACLRTTLPVVRARGMLAGSVGVVNAVGVLAFFLYGGALLLRGDVSQGAFFAFWLALGRMTFPIFLFGSALSMMQRGRAGFARLSEIFDARPEVVDGPGPAPRRGGGALAVRDLVFAYGDRPVLRGVSFEVPAGGSIAIVGRTGSGKSTLAMLLARLLPTPKGAVFVNGHDVCDAPLAHVRRAVGYAQQDAFLFSTTVARNVGFALDDPDSTGATAIIRKAAREAEVEAEILGLPEQFATIVGERGVQLSGGQRQRVALARSLVWEPDVLILDDPLSAVDASTEARILDATFRRTSGRTLVLVTNRISAAARCDHVLVLDEGRVVEQGTHATLAKGGGLYGAFAEEQSMAAQLEEMNPALPAHVVTGPAIAPEEGRADRTTENLRAFHEETSVKRTGDARLALRVLGLLRPHARLLVLSLVLLALIVAANLGQPVVMGDVVERAAARDAGGLLRDGIALAGLFLALEVLWFAQRYAMQLGGARAMADLRGRIVRFLHRLEVTFFDRTPVGRLVTRATSDVEAIGEIFSSGALNAIGDFAQLAGVVVLMLVLDWRLSLVAFASLPFVALVVDFVRKRSREAFRDIRAKSARLGSFLNEQIGGIAVVQAYGRERAMERELDEMSHAHRAASKRAIRYEAVLEASFETIGTLSVASMLLWTATHRTGDHVVTFALLVAFRELTAQFFAPVSLLADRYVMLQAGLAGAERVFELFEEKDVARHDEERAAPTPDGPADEVVRFDGVSFGYKANAPVIRDSDLTLRRGEKVALVGATGAGKTTVASLALRLYEPQAGSIRVLGKDVRGYRRSALRASFSVVPQEVFLFAGSVLSNIGVGDAEPDRARAEKALQCVGALETFQRREGGLDAPVAERGANFSAGERQLIAFARAVYRDAPILVLDEATASIDSATEARLQRALAAVMVGRTTLVIAHRLSTIRSVDKIVVFHKGRVVEQGPHEELLAKGGVYARLHRMHFAHEQIERVRPATA